MRERSEEEGGMERERRVGVLDTTLRDGEQTPGISFTPEAKLKIALQLDEIGVDIVEA